VNAILSRVAEAGSRAKLSLVLFGAFMLGGAATAGWALTREDETPVEVQTTTPAPKAPESVPERTKRLFEAMRPRLETTLRKLALGHGDVELKDIDPYDARISFVAVVRHNIPDKPGMVWRLHMIRNTHTGWTEVLHDANGGQLQSLDSKHIWTRNPFGGKDFKLRVTPVDELWAILDELPRDEAAAAAWEQHVRHAKVAIRPYLGRWWEQGSSDRPVEISIDEGNLVFQWLAGPESAGPDGWDSLRVHNDGSLTGSWHRDSEVRYCGDRIEFTRTGSFLTREPVSKNP
jgi:hypothetical protein